MEREITRSQVFEHLDSTIQQAIAARNAIFPGFSDYDLGPHIAATVATFREANTDSLKQLAAFRGQLRDGQHELTGLEDEQRRLDESITNALAAGKPVTLVLDNKGALEHDVFLPALDVHVRADPRKSGQRTLTFDQAGTYEFECSLPGHKEAGMKGKLMVQ